jgi:hypothetical protein
MQRVLDAANATLPALVAPSETVDALRWLAPRNLHSNGYATRIRIEEKSMGSAKAYGISGLRMRRNFSCRTAIRSVPGA